MAKIIGSHIPTQIKNLAINGALDYWQQNGGNTVTVNTATGQNAYSADMLKYLSAGGTNKNYSLVRSTDVPSTAQSGFTAPFSALFTMITGIASPAAADFVIPYEYLMEGNDYAKIHAKTATFSFWAKGSVAGTYSFALGNAAANRSYVTTFTLGAATWTYVTITVPMDNTGTWGFSTGIGLAVYIGTVAGTSVQTASLNQWSSSNVFAATGATNWQATSGATLQITQLAITEGPLGFSATGFARAGDDIQAELALCQRYYETGVTLGTPDGTNANLMNFYVQFSVSKRVAATATIAFGASWVSVNGGGNATQSGGAQNPVSNGSHSGTTGATGGVGGRGYTNSWIVNATL